MSRRAASWLAWSLASLCVAMFVATVVLFFLTRSVQPPSSWGTGGLSIALIFLLPFLAFPLVGALIASRRPRNPIGWICLAAGDLPPPAIPRREATVEEVAPPGLALWSGDRLGEPRHRTQARATDGPREHTQPIRARGVSLDGECGTKRYPAAPGVHASCGYKLGVALPGFGRR